jgi:hypothetical protein
MLITKTSQYSGKTHTIDLDVKVEQLNQFYFGGGLIQDIFPQLTNSEREFIKTGITDDEWTELFGE